MQETQESQVGSLDLEDSPGVGNGNPPQYSCLRNPMNRGAWGHKESDMTEHRYSATANEHLKHVLNPMRDLLSQPPGSNFH